MLRRLIPTARVFASRYMPAGFASYSQCGEDRIIDFFLASCGVTNATYIDAGCSHPVVGNNTYLLSRRNFRGICIDPTPGLAELYRRHRPRDVFLASALVPGSETEVVMHCFDQSMINTVSVDHADQYRSFGYEKMASQRVPALNLATVFDQQGVSDLDVLCLDVEGLDLQIVTGLDLKRVRPKLICVEVVRYGQDKAPIIETGFAEHLLANGYVKYADTYINQIFADARAMQTLKLI